LRFPPRGHAIAATAAATLLAGGIALALILNHRTASASLTVPAAGPHGLAAVGSGVVAALYRSGELLRVDGRGRVAYKITVGAHPTNPVRAGGLVWVPVVGRHELLGIRADTGAVVHRVAGTYAGAVTGGRDALYLPTWTSAPSKPALWRGHTVTRLDARTGRRLWSRSLDGIVLDLAAVSGSVWVPNFAGPYLTILDGRTGATRRTVRLPGRAVSVAVGGRCGWLALAGGPVLRLNPRTARVIGATSLGGADVDYMEAGDDGVWLLRYTSPADSVLEHVSCATGRADRALATGGASQGLVVTDRYVWAADFGHDRLLRVVKP
jgi:hypothetical protein